MAINVSDISPEISDVVRWYISRLHIGYVHNMSHIHDHNNPISLLKKYYPFEFPPMQIVPITEGEIRSVISSLKSKNSSGYDEISTKILKLFGNHISKPLAFIFNKSITIGVFPEQLKYAVVIYLHKKGDISNMAIYRPISVISVFEKAMYCRLNQHLQSTVYRLMNHMDSGKVSQLNILLSHLQIIY